MTNPYPPRREQRCDNCFFAVAFDPEITEDRELIECRRSAPPALTGPKASFVGYWPEVDALDWCGDWSPKEGQR